MKNDFDHWELDATILPRPLTTVLALVKAPGQANQDSWKELAYIGPDGSWLLEQSCASPSSEPVAVDPGYIVVAWCATPEHPYPDPVDPDEPIIQFDGSVLDPVTCEVVNHMPAGWSASDVLGASGSAPR